MVKLKQIDIFELRNYVKIAYIGDYELLDKYWGQNFNLDDAVNETMRGIETTSKQVKMNHFAVTNDNDDIGYLSCFHNNLYSFSINIKYRTGDILIQYWSKIKEVLGDKFICMLYPQNTRAIRFLKKQGMVEVPDIEPNCITLLNV